MKILLQNQDVAIVEKPAGFLSVPSSLGKSDPRPVAGILAQEKLGKLYPVHRLDFEVAGLLIFARHAKAQTQLHEIWESGHGVEKIYRAHSRSTQDFSHWPEKIEGADRKWQAQDRSGTWESLIAQGKKRSFIVHHGKTSLTKYQILESGLWDLSPLTGRRHQLRLEMSRHGFPILGDALYGGKALSHLTNEIALVAYKIVFHKKLNLQLPDAFELSWNWSTWKEKFNP